MKAHKPNTDIDIELAVFADGVKLSEYVLDSPSRTQRNGENHVECFVPVKAGDTLQVRGYVEGTILCGNYDLVIDGSLLHMSVTQGGGGGGGDGILTHKKRYIKFEKALDCPLPVGWTSPETPKDMFEGELTVRKLGHGMAEHEAEVEGAMKPGVGSVEVAVSLNQVASDRYVDRERDIQCGGWMRHRHQSVRTSGISPDHFLDLRGAKPIAQKRSKQHRTHWEGSRPGKSETFARFIFYYRSQEAIKAAGCIARPEEVRNLQAAEPGEYKIFSTNYKKNRRASEDASSMVVRNLPPRAPPTPLFGKCSVTRATPHAAMGKETTPAVQKMKHIGPRKLGGSPFAKYIGPRKLGGSLFGGEIPQMPSKSSSAVLGGTSGDGENMSEILQQPKQFTGKPNDGNTKRMELRRVPIVPTHDEIDESEDSLFIPESKPNDGDTKRMELRMNPIVPTHNEIDDNEDSLFIPEVEPSDADTKKVELRTNSIVPAHNDIVESEDSLFIPDDNHSPFPPPVVPLSHAADRRQTNYSSVALTAGVEESLACASAHKGKQAQGLLPPPPSSSFTSNSTSTFSFKRPLPLTKTITESAATTMSKFPGMPSLQEIVTQFNSDGIAIHQDLNKWFMSLAVEKSYTARVEFNKLCDQISVNRPMNQTRILLDEYRGNRHRALELTAEPARDIKQSPRSHVSSRTASATPTRRPEPKADPEAAMVIKQEEMTEMQLLATAPISDRATMSSVRQPSRKRTVSHSLTPGDVGFKKARLEVTPSAEILEKRRLAEQRAQQIALYEQELQEKRARQAEKARRRVEREKNRLEQELHEAEKAEMERLEREEEEQQLRMLELQRELNESSEGESSGESEEE